MIRRIAQVGAIANLTAGHRGQERFGHEQVVETYVRTPARKGVADAIRMQLPERVTVAGVENGLNRPPADASAAQGRRACQGRRARW